MARLRVIGAITTRFFKVMRPNRYGEELVHGCLQWVQGRMQFECETRQVHDPRVWSDRLSLLAHRTSGGDTLGVHDAGLGMDVLSDVLAVTRLGNTLLNQSELVPPFGLEIGATIKAAVHVVHRGVCWLRVDGERRPLRLVAGDVVLVPRGVRHVLADEPNRAAEPYERALAKMRRRVEGLRGRRTDDSVLLLCAEYEFDQDGPHPLLALLPRVILLQADAARDDVSLQSVVRLLLTEARQRLSGGISSSPDSSTPCSYS